MANDHHVDRNGSVNIAFKEFPFYAQQFKCMLSVGSSVIVKTCNNPDDLSEFIVEGCFFHKRVLVRIVSQFHSKSQNIDLILFQYARW
jgi:hypothetical protein